MITAILSLSLSLSLSLTTRLEPASQEPPAIPEEPGLPEAPGQFLNFKGAYPFDTQSVMEVTPNRSRAFVAEGASIAILDLTSLTGSPPTPAVIDRVPLEHAAPLALRYYAHPLTQQSYLFVAGGTMGLWRMSLCPSVLVPQPQVPTKCMCPEGACDPYARVRIKLVEDTATFQRKRCVAMSIVEGNLAAGGVPLLCVLFSARAAIPMPFGPTEMRAYKLNSDGTVMPYGNPVYFGTSLGLNPEAVGNSIVADPGDPSSVYVSMGIGWLYKVNLATSSFFASSYGPAPFGCPLSPCTAGEQMRDLAVVRTPAHNSVLYAALDYGRVLEYQGLGSASPTVTPFTISLPNGSGKYPSRIQALSQGEQVLLALGMTQNPGTTADTSHILTTGGWTTFRQTAGLPDPNGAPAQDPQVLAGKEVQVFRRDLNAGSSLTSIAAWGLSGASWGSLVLREVDSSLHRIFGSPLMKAHDVSNAFGSEPVVTIHPTIEYAAKGQSVTDGTMSLANPEMTYFGADGSSRMMLVDPAGQFQPVNDAVICGGPGPSSPSCLEPGFPNPFIYASVQTVANWRDPDGSNEWFVSGGPMWRRINDSCDPVPVFDYCTLTDPCDLGPYWWQKHMDDSPMQVDPPRVGWFIVKMKPANIQGTPPTASASEMKWWQLYSPPVEGQKAEGHDYISSLVDPRSTLVGGFPQPEFIHCVRTGSNRGLKVFRRDNLLAYVAQACGGTSPGAGEILDTPPLLICRTHVEIETDQGCLIRVPLGGTEFSDSPRNLFNNKSDIFSVTSTNGTIGWVIAVAQGWVAAGPSPAQPQECTWDDYFGRAMVGFYDVTTPAIQPYSPTNPPQDPVKVGLSNTQGHAWAVKTKTYPSGETFAFVADFAGKLIVFKVSYSDLFTGGLPYDPATSLEQETSYRFPGDPSDILAANCIDLELDGDILYCALGRAGLGVVDVSDPYVPELIQLIDTPGLVEGIARRTIDGKDQLVVSDTRCGMRVYGRVGE